MTLHALAEQEDKPLDGFGLFGVVKETGIDDEGLVEFHATYFPRQLYRDKDWFFYKALGDRKIGLSTFNPIALLSGFMSISSRVQKKKIGGNLVGEGVVQGGIIVFGKDGKAEYAYEEETGSEVPVGDILAAVGAVKAMHRERNK